MLMASALCAVEKPASIQTQCPFNNMQNLVIKKLNEKEIPAAVEEIACKLVKYYSLVKEYIVELRTLYTNKRPMFKFSLAGKTDAEKDIITSIFESMYGIVSTMYYDSETEILTGKMIYSAKAQQFITGQYLEIAVYKHLREILESLSLEFRKPFTIYRNVIVTTRDARTTNEFDILFSFGQVLYAVEVKSGHAFRELDKYTKIGSIYGIVPDRFLLVDIEMSTKEANIGSYFSDYYISNLTSNLKLEDCVREMIIKDFANKEEVSCE